jgi:Meiotically up-regulated protein Msb1/Mug8 domain
LLPFRPSSDLSSTKTFIRRFFSAGGKPSLTGQNLTQELRLTDGLVLAGVLRWVWTRLENGVVGWDSYELFAKAEQGVFTQATVY